MGLLPLEFTDCLTDSPYFRDTLHSHEKELEKTSQDIKNLVKDVKELLNASKNLSKAQRTFSSNLKSFRFECIGNSQTDDEIIIAGALKEFGRLVAAVEDERDRMLENAYQQFISPLETFRKDHVGGAKERKKKFDKETHKFCHSLERHLNLSTTKKTEAQMKEADATLEMEQRAFCQASLEYVCLLQEVQERKKFEFVETLLGFMYSWMTFYHQGHEAANDFRPFMNDLLFRIQKTRDNFDATRKETVHLMNHMLMEVRKPKPMDPGTLNKFCTRQGYLFLMEKKALGTTWTKHYCQYKKENKSFSMTPYTQTGNAGKTVNQETLTLKSCVRRMSESIEKRFCFDVTVEERPGIVYTLQALSEEDRRLWMDAMDGREPTYSQPVGTSPKGQESRLDDFGFAFVNKCISVLEQRGLEDQGLYRLVGVGSKVKKLLLMGLDKKRLQHLNLEDDSEWENKTITSALKFYFRNLPEPLMTFRLHNNFIKAAKQESQQLRVNSVHTVVHNLPTANRSMLQLLIRHLCKVAANSDKNLMTISNLGVCFGPTLLRSREESVAAIIDIKFGNVVVEILIQNYEKIFETQPEVTELADTPEQSPSLTPYTLPNHVGSISALTTGIANMVIAQPFNSTGNNGLAELPGCQRPPRNVGNKKPIAIFNPLGMEDAEDKSGSNSGSSSENENSRGVISIGIAPKPMHTVVDSTSKAYPIRGRSTEAINDTTSRIQKELRPSNMYPSVGSTGNLVAIVSAMQAPRRVRTMYQCIGENESELSFEPNEIIDNARPSREPGWLEGTLHGKTGLIPENYVEYIQ